MMLCLRIDFWNLDIVVCTGREGELQLLNLHSLAFFFLFSFLFVFRKIQSSACGLVVASMRYVIYVSVIIW